MLKKIEKLEMVIIDLLETKIVDKIVKPQISQLQKENDALIETKGSVVLIYGKRKDCGRLEH